MEAREVWQLVFVVLTITKLKCVHVVHMYVLTSLELNSVFVDRGLPCETVLDIVSENDEAVVNLLELCVHQATTTVR